MLAIGERVVPGIFQCLLTEKSPVDIDQLLQPECRFIVVRTSPICLIIVVRKAEFCYFTEVLLSLRHKYKTLMEASVLLEILRDQREELDTLRSQRFCKRKEEDMVKLESKRLKW